MQNKEASKAVKTFFMHRKDLNKKRPQSAAALRRSTSKSSSSSPSLSSLHLQRPSSAVVLNGSSEFSSQYALKTTEKHIRENVKKNDWGDAKTRNLVSKSLFQLPQKYLYYQSYMYQFFMDSFLLCFYKHQHNRIMKFKYMQHYVGTSIYVVKNVFFKTMDHH